MRLPTAPTVAGILAGTMAISSVVAPWPVLRHGWAWMMGDAHTYAVGYSYEEWAQRILWLGLFLSLAVFVGSKQGWLGAAVALVGVNVLLRESSSVDTIWLMLLCLGVVCVSVSTQSHRVVVGCLVGLALFQTVYVLLQQLGIDLLRGSAQALVGGRPAGTLGNANLTGAVIVLGAAVLPTKWPLCRLVVSTRIHGTDLVLLGMALAIACTRSLGSCLALALVVTLRYHPAIGLLGLVSGFALAVSRASDSLVLRGQVHWAGFLDALGGPWYGLGLGSWALRLPAASVKDGTYPTGWSQAHDDLFQWGYELGWPGVILLIGFLWTTRQAFRSPSYGAAYAALVMLAFFGYPFHAVTPGLAGAMTLGLSLSTTHTTGD